MENYFIDLSGKKKKPWVKWNIEKMTQEADTIF